MIMVQRAIIYRNSHFDIRDGQIIACRNKSLIGWALQGLWASIAF